MAITPNYDLDVDTSLGGSSASDYVIPSQRAIKTYVDNNSGGSDVFIAYTYTPYQNIINAYSAGKIVVLQDAFVYYLVDTSSTSALFASYDTNNDAIYKIQINSDGTFNATAFDIANNTLSNVSSINNNSAVATALNGKADTDLSNLTTTGKTVISGQWVQSTQTIIENTSIKNSNGTALQKTVTLPDDNYVYEVLFQGRVQTGTSSGNNLTLSIKSNVQTDNFVWICAAITRSSSYFGSNGNVIIPMKHGTNNLSIGRASSYNGTAWLYVLAYRRLGTNS